MTAASKAAAADLKSYIERVETIAQERRDMGDDIRAIMAEAKAAGFNTRAIRAIVKRRDQDPNEIAEDETYLETYMQAIGMKPETTLHAAVAAMAEDAVGRDGIIASFQALVPVNGEIIARVGGKPLRIWRDEAGTAYVAEYVEPKAKAVDRVAKAIKESATVLSIVPKDHVKAAADAAERRSKAKGKPPSDETADADDADADHDEPVE